MLYALQLYTDNFRPPDRGTVVSCPGDKEVPMTLEHPSHRVILKTTAAFTAAASVSTGGCLNMTC